MSSGTEEGNLVSLLEQEYTVDEEHSAVEEVRGRVEEVSGINVVACLLLFLFGI